MIYDAEKEKEILSTKMSSFKTRKELIEFLDKYEIEYNKKALKKQDMKKSRNIKQLLTKIL